MQATRKKNNTRYSPSSLYNNNMEVKNMISKDATWCEIVSAAAFCIRISIECYHLEGSFPGRLQRCQKKAFFREPDSSTFP